MADVDRMLSAITAQLDAINWLPATLLRRAFAGGDIEHRMI